MGTSTGMVTYNSLLQAEVPSHNRGRVFAGYDMIWQTGRLISLGLGGLTADALGIQAVYLADGGLLLLMGTIGLARLHTTQRPAQQLKDRGQIDEPSTETQRTTRRPQGDLRCLLQPEQHRPVQLNQRQQV